MQSLRQPGLFPRIFLAVFGVAVVLLAAMGWQLRQVVNRIVAEQITAMTARTERVLSDELSREADDLRTSIDTALQQADWQRRLAQLTQNIAAELARSLSIDILDITTADGTILSSAHWPAAFGGIVSDPGDARQITTDSTGPWLRLEVISQDGADLVAMPTLQVTVPMAGDQFIHAGVKLDHNYLQRWSMLGDTELILDFDRASLPESLRDLPLGINQSAFPDEVGSLTAPLIALEQHALLPTSTITATWDISNLRSLQRTVDRTLLVLLIGGTLLAMLVGRRVSASLAAPLRDLARATTDYGHGNEPNLPDRTRIREIAVLREAFRDMMTSIAEKERRLVQTERLAAWRDVARTIAHEIKNPLFPIQLSIQTLQRAFRNNRDAFDQLFDESAETILGEVERIKTITNEFSNFARMPAPTLEDLDAAAIIRKAVALYEDSYTEIAFHTDLPPDPVAFRADPDQLHQVLINLIKNALEAMADATEDQRGHLFIGLREEAIEGEPGLLITVRDTGQGFPEDRLETLFEPYVTTKEQGSGLGLAVVRRIAREHGGDVAAQNVVGEDGQVQGALVRMWLPVDGGEGGVRLGD